MADIGFGGEEFGRLLEDTRRALGALRSAAPPARAETKSPEPSEPPEPSEQLSAEGTAADGRVVAVVVSGGRLDRLTVDPRAMRLGSEALCDQIKIAVNAAMDDLRAQAREAAPEAADPVALAGVLEELQVESVRQMGRFTQGVAETVAKISAASKDAAHG